MDSPTHLAPPWDHVPLLVQLEGHAIVRKDLGRIALDIYILRSRWGDRIYLRNGEWGAPGRRGQLMFASHLPSSPSRLHLARLDKRQGRECTFLVLSSFCAPGSGSSHPALPHQCLAVEPRTWVPRKARSSCPGPCNRQKHTAGDEDMNEGTPCREGSTYNLDPRCLGTVRR